MYTNSLCNNTLGKVCNYESRGIYDRELVRTKRKKQGIQIDKKKNKRFVNGGKHYCFENTLRQFEKADPIDSRVYYDENIFEVDQREIFMREWVPIGYINELETGDMVIVSSIMQFSILISQYNNLLNVFLNACKHRGCKLLSENSIGKPYIECPYHNWMYGLDGQAKYVPSDSTNDIKQIKLSSVDVTKVENIIFGNLCETFSVDTANLEESLSFMKDYDLINEVEINKKWEIPIAANWKIIVESFFDISRIEFLHPLISRNLNQRDFKYMNNDYHGFGYIVRNVINSGLVIDFDKSRNFVIHEDSQRDVVHFRYIFPNLFIILFPHHMVTFIVNPISNNRTNLMMTLFTRSSNDKEWIDNLAGFYEHMISKDVQICEELQKNVESQLWFYGKYDKENDLIFHHFHKRLIERYVNHSADI